MAGHALEAPRLRLRPTMLSDLDYVVSLERDPVNLPFITPWERTQHETAVRFADMRHFVIEGMSEGLVNAQGGSAVGFAILIGCRNPHHALELKRLVVDVKGQGVGRAALRVLKKAAFDELSAHRFWLDVKASNPRAKALYESEGFATEGTLREAVKVAGGYESLVVMSMLKAEFEARRSAILEPSA